MHEGPDRGEWIRSWYSLVRDKTFARTPLNGQMNPINSGPRRGGPDKSC